MANNKAFVRYANNKAVPGSLIVRKKAPSVGTWKEVSYDLCCDNSGTCIYPLSDVVVCTTFSSENLLSNSVIFRLQSLIEGYGPEFQAPIANTATTYEEFIKLLNLNFSYFGNFTYSAPDEICLQLSSSGPIGYAISQGNVNPSNWVFLISIE